MISQIWSLRNRQRVLRKITTNQKEELQSPIPVDKSTQQLPHLRLRNNGKESVERFLAYFLFLFTCLDFFKTRSPHIVLYVLELAI